MRTSPTTVARVEYDAEQIDTALLSLIACDGNASMAARRLEAGGLTVNARTLRNWKSNTHEARYYELAAEHRPKIEARAIQGSLEIANLALEVARDGLEATRTEIRDGKAKDPSTSARNAAVIGGIAIDKALTLSGRPVQVIEHRTLDDYLTDLARRYPGVVVDGTAEEIPPPALPEATD